MGFGLIVNSETQESMKKVGRAISSIVLEVQRHAPITMNLMKQTIN